MTLRPVPRGPPPHSPVPTSGQQPALRSGAPAAPDTPGPGAGSPWLPASLHPPTTSSSICPALRAGGSGLALPSPVALTRVTRPCWSCPCTPPQPACTPPAFPSARPRTDRPALSFHRRPTRKPSLAAGRLRGHVLAPRPASLVVPCALVPHVSLKNSTCPSRSPHICSAVPTASSGSATALPQPTPADPAEPVTFGQPLSTPPPPT